MKDIQELILHTVSDAVIEEKQKLTVTVEPKQLHPLLLALYNNTEIPFDYLIFWTVLLPRFDALKHQLRLRVPTKPAVMNNSWNCTYGSVWHICYNKFY